MIGTHRLPHKVEKKEKKKKKKRKKKGPALPIGPQSVNIRQRKNHWSKFNTHESADCSILLLRKVQMAESASLVSRADYSALGLPQRPESGPVFGIRQEIVA
jgi:hypothetical protein